MATPTNMNYEYEYEHLFKNLWWMKIDIGFTSAGEWIITPQVEKVYQKKVTNIVGTGL